MTDPKNPAEMATSVREFIDGLLLGRVCETCDTDIERMDCQHFALQRQIREYVKRLKAEIAALQKELGVATADYYAKAQIYGREISALRKKIELGDRMADALGAHLRDGSEAYRKRIRSQSEILLSEWRKEQP